MPKKGSPVHVAPTCTGSGEGSDDFRSYVRNLSLYFCKMLFPELELMTSWSQGNNFTAAHVLFDELAAATSRARPRGSNYDCSRANRH
jgi:hypothetical protein